KSLQAARRRKHYRDRGNVIGGALGDTITGNALSNSLVGGPATTLWVAATGMTLSPGERVWTCSTEDPASTPWSRSKANRLQKRNRLRISEQRSKSIRRVISMQLIDLKMSIRTRSRRNADSRFEGAMAGGCYNRLPLFSRERPVQPDPNESSRRLCEHEDL